MDNDDAGGLAGTVIEALADPVRRQVVTLLSDGPRRAGQLAGATGMSAPAMSRHLRVLLAAGVIEDGRIEADARARVFRLRPQSLLAVQAWLDQIQAGWHEQLASYKLHVEGGAAHAARAGQAGGRGVLPEAGDRGAVARRRVRPDAGEPDT